MIPVRFAETVAIANVKPYAQDQAISRCTAGAEKRCKEGLKIVPVLVPAEYGDAVICYGVGNTRRRYRSSVEYETGLRPRGYFETCYLLPRRVSKSYRSECEFKPVKSVRRWFSMSVDLAAKEIVCGVGGSVIPDDVFQPETEVQQERRTDGRSGGSRGSYRSVVEAEIADVTAGGVADASDVNNNATTANYRVRHIDNRSSADHVTFRTRMTIAD